MDILRILPTVNSSLAFIAACISMMYLGMAIEKLDPSLFNYSVGSMAFFIIAYIYFRRI